MDADRARLMRRLDPRLWIALLLLVTVGPVVVLLSLYGVGMLVSPSLPDAPTELLETERATTVFAEADWQDRLALRPIGLAATARVLVCETLSPLRDPRSCRARTPGAVAASRAAQLHLAREGVTGWRRELAAGSLTVWISRHWTAEQVAAYLESPSPGGS